MPATQESPKDVAMFVMGEQYGAEFDILFKQGKVKAMLDINFQGNTSSTHERALELIHRASGLSTFTMDECNRFLQEVRTGISRGLRFKFTIYKGEPIDGGDVCTNYLIYAQENLINLKALLDGKSMRFLGLMKFTG